MSPAGGTGAAKAIDPSRLPRSIGRYDLLHELASGGMATVYLGRARGAAGFERYVAIKCCHPHLRREVDFVASFLDEARVASRIHHPNVVPTLDVGEADELSLYMVMEFVDGFSLWELLRVSKVGQRTMPAEVALRITLDALAGLHAAHELCDPQGRPLNIVHRDVSPQNILVGSDGTSRIMDFGIARAESRLSVTRDGTIKGKLAYTAPEQHGLDLPEGATPLPVTRRADLYAMGVVLWEALTGRRLFWGETEAKMLRAVLKTVPAPPSTLVSGLPPALDRVVLRALERPAARRYATALEFAEAIESCGVPLANARTVGAFLQEVMTTEVTARRALLRRFADSSSRCPRCNSPRRQPSRSRRRPRPCRPSPPPRPRSPRDAAGTSPALPWPRF